MKKPRCDVCNKKMRKKGSMFMCHKCQRLAIYDNNKKSFVYSQNIYGNI